MKFSYTTKYNGVYYNAGEEVPCDEIKEETKVEEKPVEEVKVEKAKAFKPPKGMKKKTTKD